MEDRNEKKSDGIINHQNRSFDQYIATFGVNEEESLPPLSSDKDSNFVKGNDVSMTKEDEKNKNIRIISASQDSNIDNHKNCNDWNKKDEENNNTTSTSETTDSTHYHDESICISNKKMESIESETMDIKYGYDRNNTSLQQPTLYHHSVTQPKKRIHYMSEQSSYQYDSTPTFFCDVVGRRKNDDGNDSIEKNEFNRKKRQLSIPNNDKKICHEAILTTASLSTNIDNSNISKNNDSRQRPLAPSLSIYLQIGGTQLYAPRPEWYLPPVSLRPYNGSDLEYSDEQIPSKMSDNNCNWHQSPYTLPSNADKSCNISAIKPIAMDFNHNNSEGFGAEGTVEKARKSDNHENGNGDIDQSANPSFATSGENDMHASSYYPWNYFRHYFDGRGMHPQHEKGRWNFIDTGDVNKNKSEGITFENDYNTALHLAIRNDATHAAIELIKHCGFNGVSINFPNRKGITPLILAAQKGNTSVVKLLLEFGANPLGSTLTGTTALIQACHFGKSYEIIPLLLQYGANVEQANYKRTTALMRASQEGHEKIVRLLLQYKSNVNRKNHEKMSALMLASQRGHANIVKILIQAGAEIDVKTAQDSTSLMLACKREYLEVVKILVSSGCELMMRDFRGRTAFDTAKKKNLSKFMRLLTPEIQIQMMKREERRRRSYFIVKVWNLLQQERATVVLYTADSTNQHQKNHLFHNPTASSGLPHHQYSHQDQINTGTRIEMPIHERSITIREMSIHQISISDLDETLTMSNSDKILVRALSLPAPLMEMIVGFLPLPRLWEKRLAMLTNRCNIDTKSTLNCTLDLIDDILSEGGFEKACDIAGISPPPLFDSWRAWKAWGIKCDSEWIRNELFDYSDEKQTSTQPGTIRNQEDTASNLEYETNLSNRDEYAVNTNSVIEHNHRRVRQKISTHPIKATTQELRRKVNFFQILAYQSPSLTRTLSSPPFNMPDTIIKRLKMNNDIQSLVRRIGSEGIHFEAQTVFELVMLASQLILWHSSVNT